MAKNRRAGGMSKNSDISNRWYAIDADVIVANMVRNVQGIVRGNRVRGTWFASHGACLPA